MSFELFVSADPAGLSSDAVNHRSLRKIMIKGERICVFPKKPFSEAANFRDQYHA
jgi:hypothetical protein